MPSHTLNHLFLSFCQTPPVPPPFCPKARHRAQNLAFQTSTRDEVTRSESPIDQGYNLDQKEMKMEGNWTDKNFLFPSMWIASKYVFSLQTFLNSVWQADMPGEDQMLTLSLSGQRSSTEHRSASHPSLSHFPLSAFTLITWGLHLPNEVSVL